MTQGLKIKRLFTTKNKDPLENLKYELRTSRITNPDGSTVFEMKNVEVPENWSQVATDILAQKYFRKKGVPDECGGKNGSEWSSKQVMRRLTETWRYWGEKYGYFESKEDANAFEDEMKYMLINQIGAPNSPQWFNTGLAHAYGITGEAQGHFFVEPQTGKMENAADAYTHPQPHACGRWDTKIVTEEGVLNLGNIVNQNRVGLKIYDGENWIQILATKENGVRKLYRMQLANGQYIDFTDDHLVWAADCRKKDGGYYSWLPLGECLGKTVQLISSPISVQIPTVSKNKVSEELITSIKYIGEEVVYDIQTESGKFLANGIVVHNCFIQSVKDDLVNEGGIFDLMTREARLFKYGSGTGSNFSALRGKSETLSGGGKSSGLMSFLTTIDRAAGAIKSGGTTRRAAKMVCLNIDHPEVEDFINWKVIEEQKVAAIHAGSYICYEYLRKILAAAQEKGINPAENKELKHLIKRAHEAYVPLNYIKRVLMLAQQNMKPEDFNFRTYDTDFRSEAYLTVSGQNSNNSIRITNDFLHAVENGENWDLINRTDGKAAKTLPSKKLWNDIIYSTWACADPAVQFDTTFNEWHTCPADGRINATNPCSEYAFLDDTACNLASINLIKFYNPETFTIDVEKLKHASHLWTIVLEISVLMAQFPTKEIAQRSYDYRTLGLGYANLGTVLMQMGIPYSSEEAYAICGAITAIMCGQSYETSTQMAKILGPFVKYERNKIHMLRVIKNHRRAAYNSPKEDYEGLTVTPQEIQEKYCPKYLLDTARQCWDSALASGEKYGYRNAQVTVIAPTGTIGLVMDCDTTGIEPDFALVKFKKLVGGGYFKIVNQSVSKALKALNYNNEQIDEIEKYIKGHATLKGCPFINEKSLTEKGFTEKELLAIETALPGIFELKFAFNHFVLGDEFCKNVLGINEEMLSSPNLNILELLGFTAEQIEAANEYVCGVMTIEGAPHLKEIHYPIFDCANRCGRKGKRFIPWEAHVRMMAAAQPFITGAISKTINMPEEAKMADVEKAYFMSFKYMLKAVALYRDSSKLSQPLNTSASDPTYAALFNFSEDNSDETITAKEVQKAIVQEVRKPVRRKLPAERMSITHKFSVGNHEGYITIGLYEEGAPGEIFIKMSKEGSTLSGIMDAFALTISLCLQYGVPMEVLVAKFCHSRFEPSGMTGNRNIPIVKSIVDYIGRYLALKFLSKETAKKYHNEELIDRAYAETNPVHLPKLPTEMPLERTHGSIAPKTKTQLEKEQTNLVLALNNEDAPICGVCGTVMVRNGACYKCMECGETSGCS